MVNDGRPFSADEFISRLVECRQNNKVDEYGVQQALISWNEGAWDEVLDILEQKEWKDRWPDE
jgi:hypothetical protein